MKSTKIIKKQDFNYLKKLLKKTVKLSHKKDRPLDFTQHFALELTESKNPFSLTQKECPMKNIIIAVLVITGILSVALIRKTGAQVVDTTKAVKTASGLRYVDTVVGTGAEAKAGQVATVHYTGWLDMGGKKGTKFDSSVDRGQSFEFPLGAGRVIRGWDEGVAGMKIGGKRTLLIPSALGYGARGAGSVIPPNADLIFDVELLGAR